MGEGGWNWGWAHHLGTENRKHLQDCAVDEPEDTGEMHLETFRGVDGFSVCRHRSGVDDFVLIWPKPRESCMSTEDCLSPAVGCGSVPGCMHANSFQSCPTLCDPMDCSLPGSSIHGISQARILEWVSISSSRGSSQPRDLTHVSWGSCLDRQIFYHWATVEAHTSHHWPKQVAWPRKVPVVGEALQLTRKITSRDAEAPTRRGACFCSQSV